MSLFTRAKKKRKRNACLHLRLLRTKGSGNCLLPRSGKRRLLCQGSGGGLLRLPRAVSQRAKGGSCYGA